MSKKTAFFLALSILFLASCTKKDVKPTTGSAPRTVSIEYRITDASGDVTIDYLAPNLNGALVTTYATVSKTSESISFSSKSNVVYSINAKNTNMSLQNITVEIYVDGQLFRSGSLDHATLTASASGKVE